MVSPQKENGYTPIANEILEQVYKLKLNGTQFKIIMVVWRFTYGFSRKEHELSETFISKATEIHKKQISRELNQLIKCNIINVERSATFTTSRIVSFNKDYSKWLLNDRQSTNQLPPNEIEGGTANELVTTTGSELVTQENNNKTKIKQVVPDLFLSFWNAYPRKVAKAAAKKSFDKLKANEELLKQIIEALEKQKQSKQWKDVTYIPHASTYLNQRRWEDELETVEPSNELKITADGTFKI